MKYSDITLNDPNVIKRFLQRSRFKDALSFFPLSFSSSTVLDFGGGDGELCIQLARNNVSSNIVCYEPTEYISKQAEERTQGNKYHFHHAGFDHRILGKRLQQRFSCYKKVFSPIRWIAGWGSPEVYYLLKKGDPQKR